MRTRNTGSILRFDGDVDVDDGDDDDDGDGDDCVSTWDACVNDGAWIDVHARAM